MCFRSSVLDRLVAQLDSAKTRHAMEHETLLSRIVAGNMPFLVCRRRKVFNFAQTISPKVFTVFEMVFWDDTRSEQLLDMRPASFARGTPNHAGRTWIFSPQRLPD
jgi:hypothetical protein